MSTDTESITQTQSIRRGTLGLTINRSGVEKLPAESSYQIEEQKLVSTPVPFNSSLGVVAHFATWICWALYFILRLPSDYSSTTWCFWLIYLCEAAFMVQDFQPALELTFSLFGPRKLFHHTQYILKGSRAPKVSVLVTVCGEDLSVVMDTVAAAAVQQYPPEQFQVFVLDDAPDINLQKAVDEFNVRGHERGSKFQDVVYFTREKPANQRHYYKSGNLRAGLEYTAANHGSSEYFAALDADIISEPDWLARTVPHLIKNKDNALVSTPYISYNILGEDELCQDSNVYAQILEPFRDFLGCSQCSGSGYVMRRQALDTIGGWPLSNIGEDILCSNMLQEQGWKTKYIPDQLQFGLSPDSFHAYISQRIRWTYGSLLVGRRFGFSYQRRRGGNKLDRIQRFLSIMGALKAYAATIAFGAVLCLPTCFWALTAGNVHATAGRQHIRLVLMCHFIASMISKRVVYGRLGSMNVFNMTTSRLLTSPFNALCTIKSLFNDPGETSFKVSGTFVSPTDERYPARRKPLLQRMLNVTMICYAAYFFLASAALVSFALFVAHHHLVTNAARMYMHTGAALRLLDIILAALVPLRYMMFPPSLPDRRELLVKDTHGVYRSGKKEWTRRDGGSSVKLLLQIVINGLFDWL